MRISLDHMAGVFIVLAGGVVVSITLLLIERRCSNLREEVKRSGVSPQSIYLLAKEANGEGCDLPSKSLQGRLQWSSQIVSVRPIHLDQLQKQTDR